MVTMEASLSYPHKTCEYSYRVPTPPRIVVPPPALNAEALPDITLSALRSADFLNSVDYNTLVTQNVLLEWSYERRREAQMILPYLFLGPMTAAKDENFLGGRVQQEFGQPAVQPAGPITMVLGIRQKFGIQNKLMTGALKRAEQMGVIIHTVDLATNQELIHALPHTTALINDHLSDVYHKTGLMGRVLIFCESGNERSAGVVAAYLMETHVNVDYIKAMQLVQAQRFCANFDDAMKRLLQGYWDILCAKRQVAVNHNGDDVVTHKSKRSLSRDEDEDQDMDGADEDDMERFGGRTFQPFMDQPL